MNNVSITGRLTTDPMTKEAGTQEVTRFRIAIDNEIELDADVEVLDVCGDEGPDDARQKCVAADRQIPIDTVVTESANGERELEVLRSLSNTLVVDKFLESVRGRKKWHEP